jgi:hypothetical protein
MAKHDPKTDGRLGIYTKEGEDEPLGNEWSANAVHDVVAEMERHWHDRKVDDVERLELYRGTDLTEAPRDAKRLIVNPRVIKGQRCREIVDFYTGVLSINAQYSVEGYGIGNTPQRAAEKYSRWLNSIFPTMEFHSGQDTNLATTREALIYGYSAQKTLAYPQAWKNWPEKGDLSDKAYTAKVRQFEESGGQIPIRTWHVPAANWYPLLDGRNVIKHVEVTERPVGWVKKRWPEAAKDWTAKDTEMVKFAEIMDSEWVGYYIFGREEKTALRFWRHHMDLPEGQCPVALYECNKTGDNDLQYRWASLTESLHDVFRLEDTLLTQAATMVRAFWQPTVVLSLLQNWTPDNFAAAKAKRKFIFGGTNFEFTGPDGQSGEKYRLFELPGKLPDAVFLSEYIRERFASFIPPSFTGSSSAGDSGYKVNKDTENAEKRLNPIADNFARGDADKARHAGHAVKALGHITGRGDQQVYVREAREKGTISIGVNWNDIKTFDPLIRSLRDWEIETDFLMLADAATKYLSKPISAPRRWVLQNILRIDNPQEFDDEALAELLEQDPAFFEQDKEAILRKMGLLAAKRKGITDADAASQFPDGSLPPGVGPLVGGPNGSGAEGAGGPVPIGAEAPLDPAAAPEAGAVAVAAPPPPVQSGRPGQAQRQPRRRSRGRRSTKQ